MASAHGNPSFQSNGGFSLECAGATRWLFAEMKHSWRARNLNMERKVESLVKTNMGRVSLSHKSCAIQKTALRLAAMFFAMCLCCGAIALAQDTGLVVQIASGKIRACPERPAARNFWAFPTRNRRSAICAGMSRFPSRVGKTCATAAALVLLARSRYLETGTSATRNSEKKIACS